MYKVILSFFLMITVANAQLELNDASVSQAAPKKTQNTKKNDDGGIFSFMNFSFKKNKDEITTKDSPKETLLEKLNRLDAENNIDAQLQLAYIYLYGDEVLAIKPDYNKAFNYYDKAAKQNDVIALNNLGNLHFSGIGTPINKEKAAQYFLKAANLGNDDAAVNLAFMYLTANGIAKDDEQAIYLFAKASKKDNVIAKFMLGQAYYKGFILPKDYERAFENIKFASEAGFDEAQYMLAVLYMEGLGTPQNYGFSVELLQKSLAQGNVSAINGLAGILADGKKYPKDLFTAHILYNLASIRGVEGAAEKRNLIEKDLKIEEILQAQTKANQYVARPTDNTAYIRKTFGGNIRDYIN